MARRVRGAGGRRRATDRGADRQYACEGPPLGSGRKRGAHFQAIGVSRGGRNTKVHALTDRQGAAEHLLGALLRRCIVHADRAYDNNRIRDLIEEQGAVPNIPPKSNRRWKSCLSKTLYKGRNAIERMFCRLKDCRRHRHTIGQTRRQLPRQHTPRRLYQVVVMSLGPRHVNLKLGA